MNYYANKGAADALGNATMTDKVINNAGWAIYLPSLLISGGLTVNKFNKNEYDEYFVYYLVGSIFLFVMTLLYVYTYYKNKDINKILNYIAMVPIIIFVLFIMAAMTK